MAQKVYRHSMDESPRALAPLKSADTYSNEIITAIFDTLYEYKYLKDPWELKPNLAVAMPEVSSDGLTFTIEIKKGVFFTDDPAFKDGKGREVVAQDFVYSIKNHFHKDESSNGQWLWIDKIVGLDEWGKNISDYDKEIEGLKAIDKYKIQIKLKEPYPQLIYTLAMGYSAVVAREVVEKYGPEIGVHPVGSGPFMLKSFNTKKCVLVRNPKYRDEEMDLEGYDEKVHGFTGVKALAGKKLPLVDQVEIDFINNEVARWNSLNKSNEIQYGRVPSDLSDKVLVSKKPVKLTPEIEKKMIYVPITTFGYVYQNFNMDDPSIGYNKDPEINKRNKALRLAIRKGFNWPDRIDRFYFGIGEAQPGILIPGIEGYDPNISRDAVTYDPEGAKKLLKDNGWDAKTLPVLEYHTTSGVKNKQMYEQFRGWMKIIGYPINKIVMKNYATFGDFSKAVHERKCMFYGMGWGLDYPDAQNVLQLYYGPHESPGANGANFKNEAYDALYKKAITMMPGPERADLYKKMNQILIDEVPNIAGFSRTRIHLWHKNVVMFYRETPLGNVYKYVDITK